MITPPKFSLVIPAYNEEALLPRLLDTVEIARKNYRGGVEAIEVIIGDNSSTDATARIAAERGCRVAHVEKRIIGAARNGGAALARGEIICFTDADMQIHPQTFNVIEDMLSDARTVGGATGVWMERLSVGVALSYAMIVPMVWLTGFDTGVVFCRRKDFQTIGGYSETRLFAEDVEFLAALRKLGKSRGQKLRRATSAKAIASTRKFDTYGDWHYFLLFFRLFPGLLSPRRTFVNFATKYWYDDRA